MFSTTDEDKIKGTSVFSGNLRILPGDPTAVHLWNVCHHVPRRLSIWALFYGKVRAWEEEEEKYNKVLALHGKME